MLADDRQHGEGQHDQRDVAVPAVPAAGLVVVQPELGLGGLERVLDRPAPPLDLDPAAWRRLSAGEGTEGPRLYDWAHLELAELEAAEYEDGRTGLWTRGLLVRRSIADGECAYFTTWCPAGTAIETLVKVEGHRWAIEDGFETAKTEFGLDHNETRSWHGWHRHVSLVMLAFAMMAAIRRRANRTGSVRARGGNLNDVRV